MRLLPTLTTILSLSKGVISSNSNKCYFHTIADSTCQLLDEDPPIPQRLSEKIKSNTTVTHDCKPGRTIEDGIKLINREPKKKFNLMIIMLGGNDALMKKPLNETKASITKIINHAFQKSHAVVVAVPDVTKIPRYKKLEYFNNTGPETNRYLQNITRLFKTIPQELNASSIVNLFNNVKPIDTYDGMHPNNNGQVKVTNNLLRWLNQSSVKECIPPNIKLTPPRQQQKRHQQSHSGVFTTKNPHKWGKKIPIGHPKKEPIKTRQLNQQSCILTVSKNI